MKTFISNIIPQLQIFSKKLDNLTLLQKHKWVQIDDVENIKNVFIFRKNKEVIISKNGIAKIEEWDYIDNDSLYIKFDGQMYLFKHGFLDDNIFALNLDNSNKYLFFINETKYEPGLNAIADIEAFLKQKYLGSKIDMNIAQGNNNYSIQKMSETISLYNFKSEIYKVKFNDGLNGDVFLILKNRETYFKDSKSFNSTVERHYDTIENCIDSLHNFLTTGMIADKGYKDTVGNIN